ncbi:uncharacterized protein B0H18DRAFT_1037938 [Fomitopsis serialis]|uniref:uncharacterized protein n=1 Tax=Fomitopsis serialis TaxID=139415 RepID=UPI0020085327|nr:uncharacterized protein B0H18DRAFT_1037938 [Neoantrodia serialis]KAH9916652.1 hypothetical protein B0H18DRAFT_1037938 [Neoantrodia serialis]
MLLDTCFLCGAEGAFERDEGLAWTFAEKAVRCGLPSMEPDTSAFILSRGGEAGPCPRCEQVAKVHRQRT